MYHRFIPINISTDRYESLIAIQTEPCQKIWIKDKLISEGEFIEILEKANLPSDIKKLEQKSIEVKILEAQYVILSKIDSEFPKGTKHKVALLVDREMDRIIKELNLLKTK